MQIHSSPASAHASTLPVGSPSVAPAFFDRARKARAALRALSVDERLARIRRLKEVILRDREAIIDAIVAATRKSRGDALMSEVFPALDHLAYLERDAPRVLADRKVRTPLPLLGKQSWVWLEPLGAVLVIAPWNYPFFQAIVPCTTSFVCGNATIHKPSEHAPMTGLVERVLAEAGFERDWVQVAYGDGKTAEALIEARPDKVFFTGSVATGKRVMAQAARQLIPVELELGGKDPMIVFDDAHVGRAAAGAAWGAFTNSGQSCTSVERLYVQRGIYERFKEALAREAARAEVAPMTTRAQARIVGEHVEEARRLGARALAGGEWDGQGDRIPAIVLEGVTPAMRIAREETFGPVAPLIPFDTEEEAIRLANDSEYGLSASVWSADLARAKRVARALVTGNVSINNVMLTEANPALPFGGVRASGFGRLKGEEGLRAFSSTKSVLVDRDGAKREANWYPYTPGQYRHFTGMMLGLFAGGLLGLLRFAWSGLALEREAQRAGKPGKR